MSIGGFNRYKQMYSWYKGADWYNNKNRTDMAQAYSKSASSAYAQNAAANPAPSAHPGAVQDASAAQVINGASAQGQQPNANDVILRAEQKRQEQKNRQMREKEMYSTWKEKQQQQFQQ
ncbi:MAG: hypothetical protein EOM20_03370 [Spartobacteria bacterium]|nr:hypothetical protein [Spartobacteria bacterium]